MPFVASDLLLGANLFFDQDLTRNHRRVSLGGELADADLMLSANVYQHVSGWRSSEDFASDYVEERAADGWDVRARYKVPYVEHLTLMGSYERWRGDHVAALGASDSIGKNPSAYQIGLEYRPVPALLFSASQQWDSVNEKSTRIGVAMNVPISADWGRRSNLMKKGRTSMLMPSDSVLWIAITPCLWLTVQSLGTIASFLVTPQDQMSSAFASLTALKSPFRRRPSSLNRAQDAYLLISQKMPIQQMSTALPTSLY